MRRGTRNLVVTVLVLGVGGLLGTPAAAGWSGASGPAEGSPLRERLTDAVARGGPGALGRGGALDPRLLHPRSARAFEERELNVVWRVRAEGTRYRTWVFMLTRSRYGSYLSISTQRMHTDSNTEHHYGWDTKIKQGSVRSSPDLRRVSIRLDELPSGLGTIKLRTASTGALRSQEYRCAANGKLLATGFSRSARLEGRVRIRPNLPGLPNRVAGTSVGARVEEVVYTGRRCRDENGEWCRGFSYFEVSNEESGRSFDWLVATRRGQLLAIHNEVSHRVFRFWLLYHEVDDWPVPLGVGGGVATIGEGMPKSPFSGMASFTRSGTATTERFGGCRVTTVPYDWESGAVTAAYDAGSITFTGPDLQAAHLRVRKV